MDLSLVSCPGQSQCFHCCMLKSVKKLRMGLGTWLTMDNENMHVHTHTLTYIHTHTHTHTLTYTHAHTLTHTLTHTHTLVVVEYLENISEQVSGMDSSGERDNEQVKKAGIF